MANPAPPSLLRRILLFTGSVKMTIVLLVLGVIVMAFGTILESNSDAAVAQATVYRTFWFDFFLLLIVLNLTAAVINRLPLKRHQLSFAVTHASIIALLFGAWISREFGYEGMLYVSEGSETATLRLGGNEIVVTGPAPGEVPGDHVHVLEEFRLPDTVFLSGYELRAADNGRPGIRIEEYLHDGLMETELVSDSSAGVGPGIEFTVSGMGESLDGWLLAHHADRRRNDVGPFALEILHMGDEEAFQRRLGPMSAQSVVLVERGEGRESLSIPVPDGLGAPVDFGGGVSVAVIQYANHARVIDGELIDDPAAPRNPAAVVEVTSAGREERHIVFSEFPDFAVHQVDEAGPLTAGVSLESSGTTHKPLFSVLIGPGGKIYHQYSTTEGRVAAVEMPVDGLTPVSDTPFQFEMRRYLPQATLQTSVRKAEKGEEGGGILARVVIGDSGESIWLQPGQSLPAPALGAGMQLAFQRQARQLPFKVALDAFDVEYYEGTMRAANYSSQVRVSSTDGHVPMAATTISMNRPLDYAGFRLFQSSYVLGEGDRPDTTILSVSYDPGVPIVYGAFVFLILGVGWYVMGDGRAKHRHPQVPTTQERDILLVPDSLSASDSDPATRKAADPLESPDHTLTS